MKPWQKGFELDYLKELELRFSSYNDYAQHELSKFKKNNIADALSKDNITLVFSMLLLKLISSVKSITILSPCSFDPNLILTKSAENK